MKGIKNMSYNSDKEAVTLHDDTSEFQLDDQAMFERGIIVKNFNVLLKCLMKYYTRMLGLWMFCSMLLAQSIVNGMPSGVLFHQTTWCLQGILCCTS